MLMEQIKACKREETVINSSDLGKSISTLHSTLTKKLSEIRAHLKKNNSTTPEEDRELHRAATKLNRELDGSKSNLISLEKALTIINERGILDWSNEEMVEILPSIDSSYAEQPNIEGYQELVRERELIKSRLIELKKQISAQSSCLEKFRSDCSTFRYSPYTLESFSTSCDEDIHTALSLKRSELYECKEYSASLNQEGAILLERFVELGSVIERQRAAYRGGQEYLKIIQSFASGLGSIAEWRENAQGEVMTGLELQKKLELLSKEHRLPSTNIARQRSAQLTEIQGALLYKSESNTNAEKIRNVILENQILSMADLSLGNDPLKEYQEQRKMKNVTEPNPEESQNYKIRRVPIQQPRREPASLPTNTTLSQRIAPQKAAIVEPRSISASEKFVDMMKQFGGKLNSAFIAKLDRDSSYASCVDDLPDGVYETRDEGVQTSADYLRMRSSQTSDESVDPLSKSNDHARVVQVQQENATTRSRNHVTESKRDSVHAQEIRHVHEKIFASSDSDEKSKSINSWVSEQQGKKEYRGYPSLGRDERQASRPSLNQATRPSLQKKQPGLVGLEHDGRPSKSTRPKMQNGLGLHSVLPTTHQKASAHPNRLKKKPSNPSDYLLFHLDTNTATPFNLHDAQSLGKLTGSERSGVRDVTSKLKVNNDAIVREIGGRFESDDEDIRRMF